MTTPKWKHDCTACIFLGQTIGGGRLVDLYAHPNDEWVSLIARYGDEGHQYYCSTTTAAQPTGHAELFAARALWFKRQKETHEDQR